MLIELNRNSLVLALATCGLIALSGCKKPSLIQGIGYNVEPNLETVKVELNFSKDVSSDLGGTFAIKDYGQVEIEPSAPDNPFNVGFRPNTNVFNDQDYVNLEPTSVLPGGQPIPVTINRALAQVALKQDNWSKFDVYAYVDVLRQEWFGVAMTLKFVNQKNFPAGLSISQQWVRGTDGYYRVAAAVFGPKVDDNGALLVPGGIALFANIRSLIRDARETDKTMGVERSSLYLFDGLRAPHYRRNPRDAHHVGEAFKALLKMNDSRVRR